MEGGRERRVIVRPRENGIRAERQRGGATQSVVGHGASARSEEASHFLPTARRAASSRSWVGRFAFEAQQFSQLAS